MSFISLHAFISCLFQFLISGVQVHSRTWNRKNISPVDNIYLDELWKIQSMPELQIPIIRAPYPTFGMVLPLPHSWSSTERFYAVDVDNLEFHVTGANNSIITAAVDRYRQLIVHRTGLSVYAPHWSHQESQLSALANREPRSVPASSPGTAGSDPHLAERSFVPWSEDRNKRVMSLFDSTSLRRWSRVGLSTILIHTRAPGSSWPSLHMDESYVISVDKQAICLFANETWGVLRGLESLSQLLWRTSDGSQVFINQTYIFDRPRFAHRGLLVDTSRHFISKSILLINLEAMAHNKLNVFHWHLIDDNSYPFRSDVYPDLSDKGSYRRDQVYTTADIREIVEFARMRGIRVIPEFDMPGHSRSLAYSQPDILAQCLDPIQEVVHFGPLNVYNENTFVFLQNLFQEIVDLFPDEYIHLGGDEVDQTCWDADSEMQRARAKLGLDDTPLSEYFWRRVQNMFTSLGNKHAKHRRRLIMWEEVFSSVTELHKSTVMHVWKPDPTPYFGFANQLIFSSCWYLDLLGDNRKWASYYMCDPLEKLGLTENSKPTVLGGEACMWSEYQSDDTILTRIWPVTSGVAERLWSPASINNLETLGPRIEEHRCRMISRGFPQAVLLGPGTCSIPGAISSSALQTQVPVEPFVEPVRLTHLYCLFFFFMGFLFGAAVVLCSAFRRDVIGVLPRSKSVVFNVWRVMSRQRVLVCLFILVVCCIFMWMF